MNFKSKTAAFVAVVAGVAFASSLVFTPVTHAQSVADLQSQIAALLAQIAQLQGMVGGGSTTGGSAPVAPLTLGSSGAQVTALQNWLISKGYSIPAGATGYFGAQTQSAVAAFQAANGISPAAGYYGPVTAAKVAMMMGPTTPGTTPGTGSMMDGTDGSVTMSYVSYAPASQTLNKGDMNKPVISAKFQAVNGKVKITRFDVHFSERPWLIFGKLTLTDSTGAVLATKQLSSAADATEVTVGSDYLVRFDNVNVDVMPGSDKILAVTLDVLAASDKITGQIVYVGVPSGSVRTINGKGYTDSVGFTSGIGSGVTNGTGNAVTLSSSGSTGTIYTRIDPSSPASDRTIVTNATQTTSNVVLGVFGVKIQNQNGTINSMSFNINNSTGAATTTLYSNLRLQAAGLTYGSNNPVAGNTTFTNMTIPLAKDQWIPVTLLADVNANQTGISASSTLVGLSIDGVDANYNDLDVDPTASNQTSTNNIYSLSGIGVASAGTPTLTNCGSSTSNGPTDNCSMTMSFTVTNVGNSDIYLSKTPSIALATSSSPTTSSTTLSSISIASAPGDTSTSYIVAANSSRTFTYSGRFGRPAGLAFESFNITGIRFGTTTTDGTGSAGAANTSTTAGSNAASIVTYGLENLRVTY